jgi:hypothetical protein
MTRYGMFCALAAERAPVIRGAYFIPPWGCVESAGIDITNLVTVHNNTVPIDQLIDDVEADIFENGFAAFFYSLGFRYVGFQHADMACTILLHRPQQVHNHA